MGKSLERKIIDLINKENLSKEESVELIDELYWADWNILEEEDSEIVEKIFDYLSRDDLSYEETSKLLKLYNNLDGAYIMRFANLILNIYKNHKKKFLKSLNLEKEEAINLVYIFRMNDIKLDEDKAMISLIDSDQLTEEEKNTGKDLLKMYENICNT